MKPLDGEPAYLGCNRVFDVQTLNHVPGPQIERCEMCSEPIYVAPSSRGLRAKYRGLKIVCLQCMHSILPGEEIQYAPEQVKEFERAAKGIPLHLIDVKLREKGD